MCLESFRVAWWLFLEAAASADAEGASSLDSPDASSSFLVSQAGKDPCSWTCPFQPPVQLYFVLRNPSLSGDFGLSRIRIWNYYTLSLGVSNCFFWGALSALPDGEGNLLRGSGEEGGRPARDRGRPLCSCHACFRSVPGKGFCVTFEMSPALPSPWGSLQKCKETPGLLSRILCCY